MANSEEIIISIDGRGNTVMEVRGVEGKRCINLTAFLEEELGQIQNRRRKPEYYQPKQIIETIAGISDATNLRKV